jgi:hypothetical protein
LPGEAVVYVYRQVGLLGAGIQPDILVDGQYVASLPPGGYLRLVVPIHAGSRRVAVDGRACIPLRAAVSFLSGTLPLSPGEVAYVELDIVAGNQAVGDRYIWNNRCRLRVADPAQALKALQSLKLPH